MRCLLIRLKVCGRDSGAWAVNTAAPELYSNALATNFLGDAYVIPIMSILTNIRDCLGAVFVHLPCHGSFGSTHDENETDPEHLREVRIVEDTNLAEK